MNNELIDLETILPYGEKLFPLLVSSFLTTNDLYQILKMRGIFLSSSEKESTIPILRNIIMSPVEFNNLRGRQKNKEDRPKTSTTHYEIDDGRDLFDLVKDTTLVPNQLIVGKQINYQIEGVPTINIKNENHVYYEFKITRNDVSKDWANSKSRHSGRVDFEKDGRNITITNEYTSDETKELGKLITKETVEIISKRSEKETQKPLRILFDKFDNISRIKFLFSILEDNSYYTSEELSDVSFGPDQSKPLEEDALWMKDRVESLKLKGKKLGDIEYFSHEKYQDSMLVEALEASINLTIDAKIFKATIRFGFDGYLKTRIPDTEFVLSINSICDEDGNSVKSTEVAREIQKRVNSIKIRKYLEYAKT